MATTVKVSVEAEDTSKTDPRGNAGPLAQRTQAERYQQQAQRPVSGLKRQLFDRVGAQGIVERGEQ